MKVPEHGRADACPFAGRRGRADLQVPPDLLASTPPPRFASTGRAEGLSEGAWRLLRCNPWSHGGVDPA